MDESSVAGTPTIRGTDISVESMLEQLAENPDAGTLLAEHPKLTMDDVRAAPAYAGVIVRDAAKHEAARERRFERMLSIAQRNPDGNGDALLEELEREDAERLARSRE
ncbi:MAG: DUF433 domain-containing protein [Dehalococcoidia bacterium]